MTTTFKELGLVNTKEMFKKAYHEGYAIPAFNFVTLEQMQAIIDACIETNAPFIMQSSANVTKYIGAAMVRNMIKGCTETIQQAGKKLPMALNLDHGLSYEECVQAIDNGFSSVMIDGSMLPFEENIALTAKVVEYAHKYDVSVEGELGVLSGVEEDVVHSESKYTDPSMVEEFVKKTGVDSLAISIGTAHGVVKPKVNPNDKYPSLRFDILEEVEKRLPEFPIVLHGASAILQKYVETINLFGGKLPEAQGIPEEQIKKAIKTAVCKINIASDGWIAMTATVRKALANNLSTIDPRTFLKPAREEMKNLYKYKITQVFKNADKA